MPETNPPRENLFRALDSKIELVRSDDAPMPTMTGHFCVFNEWAEINSVYEGHFLERFVSGALAKTLRERRDRMRVLFRHGLDPSIGDKVLGPIKRLEEDARGGAYDVPLLDTSYNRDLVPGLEAGLYGSSFRFRVMKEDFVRRPKPAAHNPDGLPERTVTEAYVREFGPCTFPAYEHATAGLRSITDEILREQLELGETTNGRAMISVRRDISDRDDESWREREERLEREQRQERLYARTIEHVANTPWAIEPGALATILTIIAERAAGKRLTDEEIQERIGMREDPPASDGPVAVLSLRGPIVPHAGMVSATSSKLASVEDLRAQFRDALASEDVKAILFDIDSPGGSGALIPEFAAEIQAARGEKPIVAVANVLAASAAYWIATAADEIVVTPSGMVGSVGVYVAHTDISALEEKAGIKTTLVSAGKYKVEGNPFEPLDDAAKAELQAFVDEFYDMFVGAVAKGRGVEADVVQEKFGQGRLVTPSKAVRVGMADRVATFDETLQRLTKTVSAEQRNEEPEPSVATTPAEPEPPEATTHSVRFGSREEYLEWLSRTSTSSGRSTTSARTRER